MVGSRDSMLLRGGCFGPSALLVICLSEWLSLQTGPAVWDGHVASCSSRLVPASLVRPAEILRLSSEPPMGGSGCTCLHTVEVGPSLFVEVREGTFSSSQRICWGQGLPLVPGAWPLSRQAHGWACGEGYLGMGSEGPPSLGSCLCVPLPQQLSQAPVPVELLAPLTSISVVGCSVSMVASLLTLLLHLHSRCLPLPLTFPPSPLPVAAVTPDPATMSPRHPPPPTGSQETPRHAST